MGNDCVVHDVSVADETEERVGRKAKTLSYLIRGKVRVPRFFVVPVEVIRNRLLAATPDAAGSVTSELLDAIGGALEYLPGELFMIRSSLEGEDDEGESGAGRYRSESMVERRDVVGALVTYVEDLLASNLERVQGGLVIQEMILGDLSGVCFTIDPVTGNCERMLIEAVPGGNEPLTDGRVVPVRYIVERATNRLVPEENRGHWRGLISSELMTSLIGSFRSVEACLTNPQDIEWTVKGGEVWILQSRAVTTEPRMAANAQANSRQIRTRGPQNIGAIYRAYRIPLNIQRHLLRTAAIGAVVCDNWRGSRLNRHDVILTLLLHDVGNIVKVDYDRFPMLFPEELENLPYWRAVQAGVRERFGDSDQEVTLKIATELAVSERVCQLLRSKLFVLNDKTMESQDWELKICAYADQRVAPFGVLPLLDRLKDAKERYRSVAHASVNDPRYKFLVECAETIERQLGQHMSINLGDINDDLIAPYENAVREFSLEEQA